MSRKQFHGYPSKPQFQVRPVGGIINAPIIEPTCNKETLDTHKLFIQLDMLAWNVVEEMRGAKRGAGWQFCRQDPLTVSPVSAGLRGIRTVVEGWHWICAVVQNQGSVVLVWACAGAGM